MTREDWKTKQKTKNYPVVVITPHEYIPIGEVQSISAVTVSLENPASPIAYFSYTLKCGRKVKSFQTQLTPIMVEQDRIFRKRVLLPSTKLSDYFDTVEVKDIERKIGIPFNSLKRYLRKVYYNK